MSTETPTYVRILVADDHDVVRHGLRCALSNTDLQIAAEASDAASAIRIGCEEDFDIVLLDLGWRKAGQGVDGLDILSAIHEAKPELPILIFTVHDQARCRKLARQRGASGYVVKGASPSTLLTAINRAIDSNSGWFEYESLAPR